MLAGSTAPRFLDHPLFVCGHRRSGTSLLLSLFDGHPELAVFPAETGFFYAVYPLYASEEHSLDHRIAQVSSFCIGNLKDFLASLPADSQARVALSTDALRTEFESLARQGDGSFAELLRALIQAYWSVCRRPPEPTGWVEKTTSSEIYAAEIKSWYPGARFVHVIRDPRDNWASMKSGWESRFKHFNDSLDRLMHSLIERGHFGLRLALENQRRLGEAYRVVRYEDLTDDVRSVMEGVSGFVGIDFDEVLTSPTVCGQSWAGNNYLDQKFRGVSSANVGRWRERISESEARLIEYHFEDVMRAFGYSVESSIDERVDAAVSHYKWHNYAQAYSFAATRQEEEPR